MKRTRWARQAACIRMNKNAYGDLVRKSEGNRTLGTSQHRWDNHIIIDLKPYGMVCWLDASGTMLGLSGGLLWTLKQIFENHKTWGTSWPTEKLLVSEGLCCLALELYVKSGHDVTASVYNILTCQIFMTYFRNLYILNIKHKKWVFTSKRGV